jgi:cardiolipin synthase
MYATLAIIGVVPGWLSVIVISRDCIILGGILVLTLMSVTLEIRPSFVSKINTTLQLVAVFFALAMKVYVAGEHFRDALIFVYWLTAAFTLISGADYLLKGMKLINGRGGNREKA